MEQPTRRRLRQRACVPAVRNIVFVRRVRAAWKLFSNFPPSLSLSLTHHPSQRRRVYSTTPLFVREHTRSTPSSRPNRKPISLRTRRRLDSVPDIEYIYDRSYTRTCMYGYQRPRISGNFYRSIFRAESPLFPPGMGYATVLMVVKLYTRVRSQQLGKFGQVALIERPSDIVPPNANLRRVNIEHRVSPSSAHCMSNGVVTGGRDR